MVIGPSTIFDLTTGGMLRMRGNLAAGSVLANGNIYRERIRMPSSPASAQVRCRMTSVVGVPTVQLVPQTADIQGNALVISDATAGVFTPVPLLNTIEALFVSPPRGETFIDVVIDCTAGPAAGTLTYVDAGVRMTSNAEEAAILRELMIMNEVLVQGLNVPVDVQSEYRNDPTFRP